MGRSGAAFIEYHILRQNTTKKPCRFQRKTTGLLCVKSWNLLVDLREAFQLGRAVGAADGLDGDLALAVGADLGGRLCGGLVLGFLLAEQGVEGLQDQEQHERHNIAKRARKLKRFRSVSLRPDERRSTAPSPRRWT